MSNRSKSIIGIILSLVLVVCSLPLSGLSAFAVDDTVYTSKDGLYKYKILADGSIGICSGTTAAAYLGDEDYVEIPYEIDGFIVSEIGENAFRSLNVREVYLPYSIKYIRNYAFYHCSVYNVSLNQGLLGIGYGAFIGSGLDSVVIPGSVTSVGTYGFKDCTSLEYVSLSSSMTTVGSSVFAGCSALRTLCIPKSVTGMNANALTGCDSIESVSGEAGTFAQSFANSNGYSFTSYPEDDIEGALTGDTGFDVFVEVGEYASYTFTPSESGYYKIYSSSTDVDPCCSLYYDVLKTVGRYYDNNEYDESANFDFTIYLSSGNEYLLEFGSYDETDVNYLVYIEKQEEISAIAVTNDGGDTEVNGYVGTEFYLTLEVLPDTAYTGYDYRPEWYSSDPSVVRVNQDGLIRFISEGTATVTAKYPFSDVTGSCTVTANAIPSVNPDEIKTVVIENPGDIQYFSFTPSQSGYYTFSSSGDCDTFGCIYDSDFNELKQDDDSGVDSNFSVNYNFTAGETYILWAKCYGENTGEYTVSVVKSPDATSVEIEAVNTRLCEGMSEVLNYTFYPYGCAIETVSAVSDNESVLTIRDDEDGNLLICGVSEGTATVTLTSKNGLTDSVEITVAPATVLTQGNTVAASVPYNSEGIHETVFKFTAPEDGEYTFGISDLTPEGYKEISLYCDYLQTLATYSSETLTAELEKGKTYSYRVELHTDNSADFTFNATVLKSVPATAITMGIGNEFAAELGKRYNADVRYLPWNHIDEDYTLTSSDENVVRIEDNVLIPLSVGTATVTAQSASGLTASCTVTVPEPEAISVGDTKKVVLSEHEAMAVYKFVPSVSGEYVFYSSPSESSIDTYGYLYDSNFNEIASNDDGGENNNFKITYSFEAGQTYYLAGRTFNHEPGEFMIHLEIPVIGDINYDGKLGLDDYSLILSQIENETDEDNFLSYEQMEAADVNADGAVDAFDLFLVDKLLGEKS